MAEVARRKRSGGLRCDRRPPAVGRPARPEPPRARCARHAGRSSDSRAQHHAGLSGWRVLLAVASQAARPSAAPVARIYATGTAVVPAHRCGAVPDSHRVPSCFREPGNDSRNQLRAPPYVGTPAKRSTTCRAGVSRGGALARPARRPAAGLTNPATVISEAGRRLSAAAAFLGCLREVGHGNSQGRGRR